MTRRLGLLVLLCAAPALAEVKIGVYGPFTGGSAGMGVSMRNGVEMAAEEINLSLIHI